MVQHNYFGTARFYRRALSIALPVMAQLLIQNFVSLIDNFMVSGLGDIKHGGNADFRLYHFGEHDLLGRRDFYVAIQRGKGQRGNAAKSAF